MPSKGAHSQNFSGDPNAAFLAHDLLQNHMQLFVIQPFVGTSVRKIEKSREWHCIERQGLHHPLKGIAAHASAYLPVHEAGMEAGIGENII